MPTGRNVIDGRSFDLSLHVFPVKINSLHSDITLFKSSNESGYRKIATSVINILAVYVVIVKVLWRIDMRGRTEVEKVNTKELTRINLVQKKNKQLKCFRSNVRQR